MSELKKRPWALLFLFSLGINLFLAGMLVSGRLNRRVAMDGPPGGLNAIGKTWQPQAQRVWKQRRPEVQDKRRAVQQSRARASEAFSSEPFDPARAAAALADLRAAQSDAQRVMHEGIVELAKELPASERARLVHAAGRGAPGGQGPMRPFGRGTGPAMSGPEPLAPAPSR